MPPPRTTLLRPAVYSAVLVPAALVAVLLAHFLDTGRTYRLPVTLGVANFVFLTATSVFVAFLAARSFLVRSTPSLLMLTCGALTWGASGAVTLIIVHDSDDQITIYNICACLAGLMHLSGALSAADARRTLRSPGLWLSVGIAGVVGFVTLLTVAASAGWTPPFFIPDQGPTLIRQLVLSTAVVTFALTGIILHLRKPAPAFAAWYALALMLLATGLLGVFMQQAYGSMGSWVGRGIQWVGGCAMLVAALRGASETHVWSVTVEQALATAQKKTTDVLEVVTDCFVAIDHEWRFSYVNAAAEALLGPRTQLLGRPYQEALPAGADHPPIRDLRTALRDGKAIHYEVFAPAVSRWLECHAYPNAEGLWIFFRDISEARAAREALRASDERLRRALDASPNAYVLYDAERRYSYANPAALRMMSLRIDEVVGQRDEDLSKTPALSPATLQRAYERRQNEHFELTLDESPHTGRTVAVDYVPLLHGDGSVREVLGIIVDITAQRQTEQSLRRAVDERTATLQKAVEDLEHFSYAMAHDMRAPLRAMAGYSDLLLEDARNGETRHLVSYLERIKRAAVRMDNLITGGLNYGRAARDRIVLAPVSVESVVRGLLETYPNLAAEHADIDIGSALPVVLASEGALTQCLSNLLDNAVKFVAPGVRPHIRVTAEHRGDMARIWVSDDGIGIPQSQRHRLFEIFSQLHTQYGGTGVGLAVVRRMVRGMGGEVGVESEEGRGSRFWIELKVCEEHRTAVAAPDGRSTPAAVANRER